MENCKNLKTIRSNLQASKSDQYFILGHAVDSRQWRQPHIHHEIEWWNTIDNILTLNCLKLYLRNDSLGKPHIQLSGRDSQWSSDVSSMSKDHLPVLAGATAKTSVVSAAGSKAAEFPHDFHWCHQRHQLHCLASTLPSTTISWYHAPVTAETGNKKNFNTVHHCQGLWCAYM